MNRPQVLLADEPTGNLDPGTSTDIMRLLARINAGGTTVVMATHEAGFVDQMQRRVIELRGGEMVRDERGGGYGDTASIPRLTPEVEKGAAAVAALTAVLEVQREVTGLTGPVEPLPQTDTAPAARTASTPDAVASAPVAPSAEAPVDESARAPREPSTTTGFIPVTTPDVDELGLADRLGLGTKKDGSDEVGPTT